MRTLAALAALALSSVATAAPAPAPAPITVSLTAAVEFRRPHIKEVCAGEALPFPLPESAATDAALEAFAVSAWSELCKNVKFRSQYVRHACQCKKGGAQ